jgi:transposase-like protein
MPAPSCPKCQSRRVLVILPASTDSTALRCQDCGRAWTVPMTSPVVDALGYDEPEGQKRRT